MEVDAPTKVVGRRVGGFLVDLVIVTVVAMVLFYALASDGQPEVQGSAYFHVGEGTGGSYVQDGTAWLWMGLVLFVVLDLAVLLQSIAGGSPGKLLFGVRVVDANGEKAGFGANLVRLVGWIVDGLPWFFAWGVCGLVTALASKGNRRVGDMMAKTYVVRTAAVGQAVVAGGEAVPRAVAPQGRDAFGNPIVPHAPTAPATGEAAYTSLSPAQAGAVPPPPPAAGVAPDWYPDPTGQARLRYWDGSAWTAHTAP